MVSTAQIHVRRGREKFHEQLHFNFIGFFFRINFEPAILLRSQFATFAVVRTYVERKVYGKRSPFHRHKTE